MNLQVYYPAVYSGSDFENNTGVLPVEQTDAKLPLVIVLPGINVDPSGYRWMANKIAESGFVVVCYSWIAEEMPGFTSLTPGMVLDKITPATYGSGLTCSAIQPILEAAASWQEQGRLAGAMDLEQVFLFGHSAGGTMALQNARPDWVPGLAGAISYAGHTGAATALGFPEKTILPVDGCAPVLILGGDSDAVIAASSHRYGAESDPTAPVIDSHKQLRPLQEDTAILAIVADAGHFSLVEPIDETNGRHFLEDPADHPESISVRNTIGNVMIDFLQAAREGVPLTDVYTRLKGNSALILVGIH
jgi:dienelactone hydrolase